MLTQRSKSRSRGFTLVEVLTTTFIAAIVLLATIYGILFSIQTGKLAREHSLAQRQAAAILEEARQKNFRTITTDIDDTSSNPDNNPKTKLVVIDDRQSDQTNDDLMGVGRLRLYSMDDDGSLTEVDDGMVPGGGGLAETIEDFLVLQAEVSWTSMGKDRQVTLLTYMAP